MKRKNWNIPCNLAMMLLVLFWATGNATAGGEKVLLVHSYHQGYDWVDAITAGVRDGLRGSPVKLEVFYMDTKRKTDEKWKKEAGQMAMDKVRRYEPDVIITADDNAQEYFARHYAGKQGPQIVFCGVNAEPETYGFPARNVTGVLERLHFVKSMNLLKSLGGDIKSLALITDDSPTSDAACTRLKTLDTPLRIVSYEQPSTFAQWQTLVKRCQGSVDAIAFFAYHTIKEKPGSMSMEPGEVMSWTRANNKKPSVGFVNFSIKDGALCGVVGSAEEHGFKAAHMARKILGGKKAGDLPVVVARKGTVMLNMGTARELGIDIRILGHSE